MVENYKVLELAGWALTALLGDFGNFGNKKKFRVAERIKTNLKLTSVENNYNKSILNYIYRVIRSNTFGAIDVEYGAHFGRWEPPKEFEDIDLVQYYAVSCIVLVFVTEHQKVHIDVSGPPEH